MLRSRRREAAEKKRRGVPVFAVAFVLALVYMAGAGLALSLPTTPRAGLDAARAWTLFFFLAVAVGVFLSIRRGRHGSPGDGVMSRGATERFLVDLIRTSDPFWSNVSFRRGLSPDPAKFPSYKVPSLRPWKPIARRLGLGRIRHKSYPGFAGVLDGVPVWLRVAFNPGLSTQVHADCAVDLPAAVTITPEEDGLRVVSLSRTVRDLVAAEETRARLESLGDARLHAEERGVTLWVPGFEKDPGRIRDLVVLAIGTARAINAAFSSPDRAGPADAGATGGAR